MAGDKARAEAEALVLLLRFWEESREERPVCSAYDTDVPPMVRQRSSGRQSRMRRLQVAPNYLLPSPTSLLTAPPLSPPHTPGPRRLTLWDYAISRLGRRFHLPSKIVSLHQYCRTAMAPPGPPRLHILDHGATSEKDEVYICKAPIQKVQLIATEAGIKGA